MEGEADSLRVAGNECFRAGNFTAAIEAYSSALVIKPNDALLLGNRSACHLAMKEYVPAAADARAAVAMDATYLKGYYRLGSALLALGNLDEASNVVAAGLKVEEGNKALLGLQRQIQQTRQKQSRQAPPQLYADRTEQQQTPAKKFLVRLMELLARPGAAEASHELQGTFKQLLTPSTFLKMMYPGSSTKQAQQLPQSLKELLQNELIQAELERSMEKIETKADSVLAGVKQKGAAQGEIMDDATEQVLRPQVLQEAFARELIDIVKRLNVEFQRATQVALQLASPSDIRSGYDQLDDNVVDAIGSSRVAIQDAYLGGEWAQVILNDIVRFEEVEGLEQISPAISPSSHRESNAPRMLLRWLEVDDIRDEYPALGELLHNMHALRYELNAKRPNCKLSVESPASTLLVKHTSPPSGQVEEGSLQLDAIKPNVKMCFLYHLAQGATSSPAELVFANTQQSNQGQDRLSVPCRGDQLVIYDCTQVVPARTPANYAYYTVYSFA